MTAASEQSEVMAATAIELERADEEYAQLYLSFRLCRQARRPEQHRFDCAYCAFVQTGGAVCRYCRAPLHPFREGDGHGVCSGCWSDAQAEAMSNA